MRHFCLIAILSLVLTGNSQAANLVTNPGFETNDFTGYIVDGFSAGRTNVVTYSGSYCCQGGTPPQGTYGAAFGGGGAVDGDLSQVISTPTIVGQQYLFSFQYAGVGDGTAFLTFSAGDANTFADYTGFPRTLQPLYNGSFQTFSGTFTATSTSTGIFFGGRNNGGQSADILLDNIFVDVVPEPSAASLLLGVGMLMARRARRQIRGLSQS